MHFLNTPPSLPGENVGGVSDTYPELHSQSRHLFSCGPSLAHEQHILGGQSRQGMLAPLEIAVIATLLESVVHIVGKWSESSITVHVAVARPKPTCGGPSNATVESFPQRQITTACAEVAKLVAVNSLRGFYSAAELTNRCYSLINQGENLRHRFKVWLGLLDASTFRGPLVLLVV